MTPFTDPEGGERHARSQVGRQLRSMHPAAFRSGEWATIVGVMLHSRGHVCFVVRFQDQMSDFMPIANAMARYQFRDVPSAE